MQQVLEEQGNFEELSTPPGVGWVEKVNLTLQQHQEGTVYTYKH